MKKKLTFGMLFLLFITMPIYGQGISDVTKVGTSSAVFLGIDVGARAVAMGGSFVAVADDATAIYWNPAGVARLPGGEIALIHTEWLAGTNFDFGAITFPLGRLGTLGASITSLSMEDMEIRTIAQPEGTGEFFGAGDLSIGLTYAINLTDRFSIGFNGKYINSRIFNESASSFALDVGTLFTTQFRGMRIGAVITNFGPKMKMGGRDLIILVDPAPDKYGSNDRIVSNLQTNSFPLPLAFRAGVAMDVLKSERNRWTIAVDAFNPSDNAESLNLGTEYVLGDLAAIRFGYKSLFNENSEEGLTVGGGVKLRVFQNTSLRLDYAYADFGRLTNAQRFSVRLQF
ncbi:PorV/PorQ family protein [candidate division KSB1 bacterium]|nr:PorV/PorQ family protein [candidate division KSB1 bacterium]